MSRIMTFLLPASVVQRIAGTALSLSVVLFVGCGEMVHELDSQDLVTVRSEKQPVADNRPVLRIAVTAMISPETTRDYYQDLLIGIGDQLGRRVVFSQRKSYSEINTMLLRKEVDVAFICSGPYVMGHDGFGLEILVVPVAHGKCTYQSYIIARLDDEAQSLADLRGMRFAFSDPDSNTGCLVPTYMLAQRGETPTSFFSDTFFTGSHDASISAVADGLACGAAVDSLVWDFLKNTEPEVTDGLGVIEKSPSYGIPPIVVHPDLNPELKSQLKELFLSLHEREESAVLLARLQIDRFQEGDDSAYDTVREMRRYVVESKAGTSQEDGSMGGDGR